MRQHCFRFSIFSFVAAVGATFGLQAGAEAQTTQRGFITGAGQSGGPHVATFVSQTGASANSFFAFAQEFRGGVSVGGGDVNNDGYDDAIVGAGPGAGPHVKVFSGRALAQGQVEQLYSFFAFEEAFRGGVYVAGGDINGDGYDDMITGAGPGGGPRVQVFSGRNGSVLRNFFAFAEAFRGGVTVGSADINGDGRDDIIVGAGPGGGPNVTVFSGTDNSVLANFFAYDAAFRGGVFVAGGDVSGDGRGDIIVGPGPGSSPIVKVYNGSNLAIFREFLPFAGNYTGGVTVGAVKSGDRQVIVGSNGLGAQVKVYNLAAEISTVASVNPYPGFNGAVNVSGFSFVQPAATSTPTAISTATPTGPAGTSTPTATPTSGGGTSTPTATPTSGGGTSTPTPTPTSTSTSGGGGGTSTPTPTPTGTAGPGALTLSLDGIYDNGDGTFTAYIGYNNTSGRDITITAGVNGSATNFFSPNPANRGQTSLFLTGNHPGAIVTIFSGATTSYTLGAEGTIPATVTFSGTSVPKLAAVEPLSQCVISGSDGKYAAVLGYNNTNRFDIFLKVGATNKFEPGVANRGQPEKFLSGLNNGAFTLLGLDSELTWKLATKSVVVKPSATECTCPAVGGASIRTQLNADALAMNKLAEKAGALILSVGTEQAKKSATDVKKRTTDNLAAIKAATVKIPNVFVTCPANETPPQCVRVDNQQSIDSLNSQFDIALHIVKRGTARGNFLKTGKTRPANGKTDPLVVEANTIYERAKAELTKYPRYNTSCTK